MVAGEEKKRCTGSEKHKAALAEIRQKKKDASQALNKMRAEMKKEFLSKLHPDWHFRIDERFSLVLLSSYVPLFMISPIDMRGEQASQTPHEQGCEA
jgi:hypothetical protein